MSRWNHSICERCWTQREPTREPHRMLEPSWETCCFCGANYASGIYVREDPSITKCAGQHKED